MPNELKYRVLLDPIISKRFFTIKRMHEYADRMRLLGHTPVLQVWSNRSVSWETLDGEKVQNGAHS